MTSDGGITVSYQVAKLQQKEQIVAIICTFLLTKLNATLIYSIKCTQNYNYMSHYICSGCF